VKVAGITLLKLAIRQACLTGAPSPSFNEIANNLDAKHLGSEHGFRECGRPVTTSQARIFRPLAIPKSTDQ
jgi:hypothetical protein